MQHVLKVNSSSFFSFCRHDLYLSFKESIFGGEREFEISCFEACERCDGTGAKSSSCMTICSTCGGSGRMMKTQKTAFGMMSEVTFDVFGNVVI